MKLPGERCSALLLSSVSEASRYGILGLDIESHAYDRFQTNIPFLFRLLTHDVFIAGKTWTTVCSGQIRN